MKRSFLTSILVLSLFTSALGASAAEERSLPEVAKPYSFGKAILSSTLGTILPIAAGVILISSGQGRVDETGLRHHNEGLIVGGIVLASLGGAVGPSIGHFYGKNPGQAWTGITIRTLSGLATAGSFIGTFVCAFTEEGLWQFWAISTLANGLVFMGSMIYDFAKMQRTIDRANDKYGKLEPKIAVAPTVLRSGSTGRLAFGFGFSMTH